MSAQHEPINPAEWEGRDFVPVRYAATIYGLSENTIHKYVKRGYIANKKQSRFRLVSRASLDAHFEKTGELKRIKKNLASRKASRKKPCGGRCGMLIGVDETLCRFCISEGKL